MILHKIPLGKGPLVLPQAFFTYLILLSTDMKQLILEHRQQASPNFQPPP